MQVPFELVDLIFQRLFPPQFILDPLLALSQPSSLWRETIRDLLDACLVSKMWYRAATPFLYEHVFISDGRQITLLLESLKSNLGLPPFIKRMTLACYIHPNFAVQFESDLRVVVEVSHHIERFSCEALAAFPLNFDPPIPPHITHLRLGGVEIGYDFGRRIAASAKNQLVHLNITLDTPHSIIPDAISFPVLEELFLDMKVLSHSNMKELEQWEIPSLRRLTIMTMETEGLMMFTGELGQFIKRLPNLEYLCVGSLYRFLLGLEFFQTILESAPKLLQLGIGGGWWIEESPIILAHPKLRWVDIWSRTMKEAEEEGVMEEGPFDYYLSACGTDNHFARARFPCLEGIRWCDIALRTSFPELPIILSPELCRDDSEVSFAFGTHRIYQTRTMIGYRLDWESESGDEDDEDYVPPGVEGEDDSESELGDYDIRGEEELSDVGSGIEDSDGGSTDEMIIVVEDNAF